MLPLHHLCCHRSQCDPPRDLEEYSCRQVLLGGDMIHRLATTPFPVHEIRQGQQVFLPVLISIMAGAFVELDDRLAARPSTGSCQRCVCLCGREGHLHGEKLTCINSRLLKWLPCPCAFLDSTCAKPFIFLCKPTGAPVAHCI